MFRNHSGKTHRWYYLTIGKSENYRLLLNYLYSTFSSFLRRVSSSPNPAFFSNKPIFKIVRRFDSTLFFNGGRAFEGSHAAIGTAATEQILLFWDSYWYRWAGKSKVESLDDVRLRCRRFAGAGATWMVYSKFMFTHLLFLSLSRTITPMRARSRALSLFLALSFSFSSPVTLSPSHLSISVLLYLFVSLCLSFTLYRFL